MSEGRCIMCGHKVDRHSLDELRYCRQRKRERLSVEIQRLMDKSERQSLMRELELTEPSR